MSNHEENRKSVRERLTVEQINAKKPSEENIFFKNSDAKVDDYTG
jgi:hypothetical protein